MEKNITATMNENSVTVRVWDNETKELYTTDVTFYGNYDEKRKASIRNDYAKKGRLMVVKFYDETLAINASEKYAMPESEFYARATVMEKRPNGDYISRTATATKCIVLLYNNYTDDTETVSCIVSGKNSEKIRKEIERKYKKTDYIVLDVQEIETITALYVLESEIFFKNATPIE